LRAKLREEWNQPNLRPIYILGGVLVAGLLPAMFSYRRKNRAKGVAA
jgi:hypothetical protein